ncbi:MAG: hypothetical protein V4621_07535 [Pseudomonadota bacterium]
MTEERRRLVFDNKIPLTWLISSAGGSFLLLASVLWNVAAQSNKLDQLIVQIEKLERRNIDRDSKLDLVIRDGYDSRKNDEIMTLRIQSLEREKTK